MAEWLRRGLQNPVHGFDSRSGLKALSGGMKSRQRPTADVLELVDRPL